MSILALLIQFFLFMFLGFLFCEVISHGKAVNFLHKLFFWLAKIVGVLFVFLAVIRLLMGLLVVLSTAGVFQSCF